MKLKWNCDKIVVKLQWNCDEIVMKLQWNLLNDEIEQTWMEILWNPIKLHEIEIPW